MIKKFAVSFCLLISMAALAQEGTASPYSYYGIGDIKFKGTIENRSMGGISVFPDSIHINLQNPAQLASLKLINFSTGGTYFNTKSNTETGAGKNRRTTLDYLAVGIPTGKLGIGFGLMPYSSVGYKIQPEGSYTKYNAKGGVTKVFLGFGYKITPKINIGADFQYNFGKIETTNLQVESIQYGTQKNNTSNVQGFNVDLSATYQTKLNRKLSLFGSVVYTPESKLSLTNSRNIELVQLLSSSAISIIEQTNLPVDNTTITLPSKWALGVGFGEVKKWLIGTEVTFSNSSKMSNRFNDITGGTFENAVRYSVGGYFIPNYNSYSSYFKKITYRAGIRYENTGLVVQNGLGSKSITDFAGTVGTGLPLGGLFSNINIGLEVGKRGTTYYGLLEENYVNLSFGLSLNDKWFVKRKYN
jgi:long-subunit fatty acid transport protein